MPSTAYDQYFLETLIREGVQDVPEDEPLDNALSDYENYFSEESLKEAHRLTTAEVINTAAKCVEKTSNGETVLNDDVKRIIQRFLEPYNPAYNPAPKSGIILPTFLRKVRDRALVNKRKEFAVYCLDTVVNKVLLKAAEAGRSECIIGVDDLDAYDEIPLRHHEMFGFNWDHFYDEDCDLDEDVHYEQIMSVIAETLTETGYEANSSGCMVKVHWEE